MLGFNTHTIDFEILDVDNAKNIIFLDASTYFKEPEGPILEIILPGTSRYLMAQIDPRKINVLDSNLIGLSTIFTTDHPIDLPDGIYKFIYKVCPYDFFHKTKYNLRTVHLDRKIQTIYCNIDVLECELDTIKAIKKDLLDIYILVESAKANTAFGKIDRAGKEFSVAEKKVNKLLDKIIK